MTRKALVTGGSRGIGAAISKSLKADGCNVAATHAGNDEAAAAFSAEAGIKTYKLNVADYAEFAAGIAQVEPEDIARCVAFLASDRLRFLQWFNNLSIRPAVL